MKQAWYFNGNFPWLGMLFCAPIIGLWYWCTDQYIVQRALGAPNETVARRGSIFAAFLKLFPVYLFIIPGLICFALAKSGKIPELAGIIGPDGHAIPATAQGAFPMMVEYLLPPGLRGIVVAGLLSALMGSLAGVFNACSTLFTVDLYEKWRPGATPAPDCANRPTGDSGHGAGRAGLDSGHQKCPRALRLFAGGPGIFGAADFRGVFLRRVLQAAERGWCALGHAGRLRAGLFRMLVDTPVTLGLPGFQNGYPYGSFLWIVNNIYFQYFSVLITVVSAIVMVVVSYMTTEPNYLKIQNLTFETTTAADKSRTRASWDWREVAGSALVLACILGSYLYFRG